MVSSKISATCSCGESLHAAPGSAPIPCPKCGKSVEFPPASEMSEGELEHVLLKRGWATLDQLRQARLRQTEESQKGRALRLGEAMVELNFVTPERVKEAIALQDKVPMKCPTCGKTFSVRGFRPGTRALCKTCKVALVPVGSITDIHVEDGGRSTDLQHVPVGESVDPAWVNLIPGYQIERRLGEGGMGQVFLARQKSLDRLVAIKVLSRKLAENPTYVQRFLAEAKSAARLNHENIVSAVDAGQINAFYYFVMEYVEGETLQSVIQRERSIPERRALEFARQIASGLAQASQQGLIHRDIKPSNIMITPAGLAKICDFGLAREISQDTKITQEGTVLASPTYASPEQCKALPNLDHRSDMYSLGVSLFEMVTGQVPFKSEAASSIFVQHVMTPPPAPRSINPAVSPAANALILRLLRKEPDKRFRDYGELLTAIVSARQSPSSAPEEKRALSDTRKSRAVQTRPGSARWAIAVVAVVLVVVAFLLLRPGAAPSSSGAAGSIEQELKDARALERAAKGKPSLYPQVRARWKSLVDKYRGTSSHNAFAGPLVEFETRTSEEAERLADVALREAATRSDSGRPLEALFALKAFPRGLEETEGAKRVTVRVTELERILDERFQQGKEAIAASITGERFDEAARKLDALRADVSVAGPAGVEYARLSYRDELDALGRRIDEDRLVARKRELEAAAKESPATPPVVVPPRKDPVPETAPIKVVAADSKAVGPAPVARKRAVPDAAALRDSEKLVRDLFKDEYAKKAPADKAALSRRLSELAAETKDDPPGRFVLLRETRDLAVAGGNLSIAFAAIDETVKEFDVNGAALKAEAIAAVQKGVLAPDDVKSAAARILKYVNEAIASEDADGAAKAAAAAVALARRAKDIPLLSKADAKLRECDEWKSRFERLRKAADTLAKTPNDPEACLIVGQFTCVVKGDWISGLALLAKGSNPLLKDLAQRDLASPSEPAPQAALGDEWWDAGEKEGGLGKDESRRRAAFWYLQASPKITGFTKTKIDKRLAEVDFEKGAIGWIPMQDPRRFGVEGSPGSAIVANPAAQDGTVLKLLPFPPGEFDGVSVKIRLPAAGKAQAFVTFEPRVRAAYLERQADTSFAICQTNGTGWENVFVSKAAAKSDYTIMVLLVGDEYVVSLDGQDMARFKTQATSINGLWLQGSWSTVTFENVQLKKKG